MLLHIVFHDNTPKITRVSILVLDTLEYLLSSRLCCIYFMNKNEPLLGCNKDLIVLGSVLSP